MYLLGWRSIIILENGAFCWIICHFAIQYPSIIFHGGVYISTLVRKKREFGQLHLQGEPFKMVERKGFLFVREDVV